MSVMDEVEDIMCDQCILSTEINDDKRSYLIIPTTKIWVAIDLITRAVIPSLINVYYAYIATFRRQLLPSAVAFVANSLSRSLASVQRITIPTLRAIKSQNEENAMSDTESDLGPEKSVSCEVLCAPQDITDITCDVIFIHGLHGGLDKTWKQGTWRNNDHKLVNQFPIQRQYSEDFYVPPKPKSLKRTLSLYYSKIPNKIARREHEICVLPNEDEWNEMLDEERFEGDYSACWPQDWLPKDCPGVRVIALNYSTDVLWCPLWLKKRNRTGLVERSQEMIDELVRIGVGKKPIVWVGHSKGGLYIKQILVNAWEGRLIAQDLCDLFNQSKAIMFYSVPHKGSSLADFTLPFLRRSVELLEIQRNCGFVLNLHDRFLEIYNQLEQQPEIFSFIETSFTLMSFLFLKIVAYESADPNIGIKCDVPLDHREICKPAGRDCFLYLQLIKLIKKATNLDEYEST